LERAEELLAFAEQQRLGSFPGELDGGELSAR
jgi:hypothetical protein